MTTYCFVELATLFLTNKRQGSPFERKPMRDKNITVTASTEACRRARIRAALPVPPKPQAANWLAQLLPVKL
jgi:hypothetical protein